MGPTRWLLPVERACIWSDGDDDVVLLDNEFCVVEPGTHHLNSIEGRQSSPLQSSEDVIVCFVRMHHSDYIVK